jgi:heat-inducible transcriptional repressor
MNLSKRAFSVLCAIVEYYIRSGEPVASRQVALGSGFGLSAATIRNVMATLEEEGYLSRPHPSAGSVPSDRGFRIYLDSMPAGRMPPPVVQRELSGRMAQMRRELVEDIEWVARLIADATREAGVAVRPMGEDPLLEAVSLVLLDDRRVLGVIVTDDGTVEKRVLELGPARNREELLAVANFLTSKLAGASLREIDRRLTEGPAMLQEDGELAADACEIAARLFSDDNVDVEVLVAGTDNLLATADFAEIDRVRFLLATLEDRSRIAHELRHALAGKRTQVIIGAESEATAAGNLGMVATLYFKEGRRAGAVGVVGPRRMDYQRVVPVVEFVGDRLTQMLENSGAGDA